MKQAALTEPFSEAPGRMTARHAPLAQIKILTPITIIIPTFKEAENIPPLLHRLDELRVAFDLTLEVLIMDDDSNDGSVEAVERVGFDWARVIVREGPRGLSPAVVDGLRLARYPVVVVMDADLSHPPEKIPDLVLALEAGQQIAIGSRYVPGGSTDDHWGFFRWLNSRIATLLARPLTLARDPMSGFFAIRRAELEKARTLDPVGYKVLLELIVKCGLENIAEIPIHFSDRVHGESKLTIRQQLLYLKHLRRLYIHRFKYFSSAAQFAAVGASGVVVNLAILTLALWLGAQPAIAVAMGIGFSVVSNFLLNRRFTFGYARAGNIWRQFGGFVSASAAGMLVNYTVTLYVAARIDALPLQAAALAGIAAGMTLNYLFNQFIVFRHKMRQG
jgi:dolichol-phosphate mannosyltransferase